MKEMTLFLLKAFDLYNLKDIKSHFTVNEIWKYDQVCDLICNTMLSQLDI